MSIRTELAKTSRSTIADFGYAMTLVRVTGSSYDSATGTNTETTSSSTVSGLVTNYTKDEIDGVTILSDDRKAIVYSETIVPSVNDRLTGVDGTMRIVSVNPVAPDANNDMFYVCQVRA